MHRLGSATTDAAIIALAAAVTSGLRSSCEPVRLARTAFAMLSAGCSRYARFPSETLTPYILSAQRIDGGWSDVEETAWCTACLIAMGNCSSRPELAIGWLRFQRNAQGVWGRTSRDRGRLPIVGLLAGLLPNLIDGPALRWAKSEWEADLASSSPLTYKAGFFLLTQSLPCAPNACELVDHTLASLLREQQDDGGFAPWKGHPIGSDPWSTGVVLWGLSRYAERVPIQVFQSAARWLERTQLPDGNWSYHYLDEGTSMALIGLSSIKPFVKG